MFDAAYWIRSLRQWIGKRGTACYIAGEGRRGGSSGFKGHWARIFECSV